MGNIIDNILLENFGLDWDSAQRYIAKGSSRYFLNCLKGEDSSYGELTNLKGNRRITYQLGIANTYFVLWSCYDPLTRDVYYYIFSQPYDITGSGDYEYDNRLIRFNEDSEVIDTIFYDNKNYLGANPLVCVKDSFVLGGWLFYNPQSSEPKIIDIEMALNYTKALKNIDGYLFYDITASYLYGDKVVYFGGVFLANTTIAVGETPVTASGKWDRIGDSYQDETDLEFDSEFRYAFNLIRHIPVHRPVCSYASDTDKHANNVRGKLFRFSHRYKYFDNTYSRYGAFSDITLPQYDEYYNGEVPGELDQFNCIDIIVPLHSAALIKEIDIIFQESYGDWKRAKVINRRDIELIDESNYTYRFYNTDSAYEAIDDTYFNEPYDSVPKRANSIEIINKNILCFGGCTEGFDNIDKNDIDVSLTPEIEEITTPTAPGATLKDVYNTLPYLITYIYPVGGSPKGKRIDIGSWYPGGVVDGTQLVVTMNGETESHYFLAGQTAPSNNLILVVSNFISDHFYPYTTTITGNYINVWSPPGDTQFPVITQFLFCTVGATKAELRKRRGFKTGAWHPFCLYYYDEAMRRWDAQTSKQLDEGVVAWEIDGTTVYVPMLCEYSPTPATTAYKWNINWEVNHLPPTGAKWWRWGYAGNALCSLYFVQYIIETIEDEGVMTRMDITPLQTLSNPTDGGWNEFPQSIITPYAWQVGDRVRIHTEKSAANDMGQVLDGVYDYEIIKYTEDATANEYWVYTQQFTWNDADIGVNSLIEIYRPMKTDTATIFHEFGGLMPIIEDSNGVRVHGCGSVGTQNQDTLLSVPVIGTFTSGDVYHILRTPSKPINIPLPAEGYFHESRWYSDFYESDDWDKGRIGVETNFGERNLNIVRHSDQYLQNTLINGLSTFHGIKYKELNDVFGDIMRIIESGDTLKVYQRKKPSSIPIGRVQYTDSAGNVNVEVESDRVFGAVNYSHTNYGTEFPESIERNNRYVYGFDIYNGVFFRDAANGIFPISGRYESLDGGGDYKMETYFKQKAKALLVSGIEHVDVFTVWDEKYKNLYVIFKDAVAESNDEALMFHEPSNKWISFTNMDQTPAEGWNQILEVDWSVLWGFDAGIYIYFNPDTRFTEFDIITPVSVMTFPDLDTITIISYDPTVMVDTAPPMSVESINLTSFPITAIATWVRLDEAGFTWTAAEWGSDVSVRQSSVLSTSPSMVTLTVKPTWLTVTNISGRVISLNESFDGLSSPLIWAYPSEENFGGVLTGTVVLTNSYGDSDVINVSQNAAVIPPILSVITEYTAVMTISNTGASSISVGSDQATIVFTSGGLSDKYLGEPFKVYWRAYVSGVEAGSGAMLTVPYGWSHIEIITLTSIVLSGGNVVVYLIEDTQKDVTVISTLDTLTITSYTVTAFATSMNIELPGLNFLATESGFADEKHLLFTSAPTGPSYPVKILHIPNWVAMTDATGINYYTEYPAGNSSVYDGYTLYIFPKQDNETFEPLFDSITFETIMGDTAEILISQAKAETPPAEPIIVGVASISPETISAGVSFTGGCSGYVTRSIAYFNIDYSDPTKGDSEFYTVYCKAFINGVNRTVSETYSFSMTNGAISGSLEITGVFVVNDALTMVFSKDFTVYPPVIPPVIPPVVQSLGFNFPGVNFTATQFGFGVAQTLVLTSRPTGGSYPVRIIHIPSWLRITDNGNNPYTEYPNANSEIFDGYTVYVYPIAENVTINPISESITFETIDGTGTEILVYQAKGEIPAGKDPVWGSATLASDSTENVEFLGSSSGLTTETVVYYNIYMTDSTKGYDESYTVYCKVYINGVSVATVSVYSFTMINGSADGYIDIIAPLVAGDTIAIVFSKYYIY